MVRYRKRQRGEGIVKVGRFWYRDYADPVTGQRVYKSLRTESKEDAEAAVRNERHERWQIAQGLRRDFPKRTLSQLFDEYMEHLGATRRANTVSNQVSVIRKFSRWLDDEMPAWRSLPLTDVDLALFETWQKARIEQGIKPSSVNMECRTLSTVLGYAVRHGYVAQNPIGAGRLARLRFDKEPPRFLSVIEIAKMREVLTGNMLDFFDTALQTGLRLSELTHLRWSDVDFERAYIRVQPQGSEWQPKTRSSIRTIGMRDEVRKVLERRFEQHVGETYVFGGEKPWNRISVGNGFRSGYEKAGIKGCNVHTTRHTFASYAVLSGVSLLALSKILGHSNITTTQIYAHLTPEHLENAMQMIQFKPPKPRVVPKCEENVKGREHAAVSS